MTVTKWTWLVIVVIYLGFFSWYSSFKVPLSPQEIEYYVEKVNGTSEELASFRKFMEEDDGDDFVMINILEMYDTPLQIEGVEPGETTDQVLGKYMEYMFPAMLSRASHPVFRGNAASLRAMDIMNADGMETWTGAAGVRYRSRRDMIEISTNPEFAGRHEFKVAALAKTIAFPVAPFSYLGDPRLILALLLGLIGCAVGWRQASSAGRA
ncbi:MAG: hypothetical protein CME47_09675 [Halieaceae bacterium]|nr:hypothetical protein [Halieaceae bacterium]|tara:strand:+ start:150 stop:779 length:630 start_codon:yes stop_codon:yes gene_type:complete